MGVAGLGSVVPEGDAEGVSGGERVAPRASDKQLQLQPAPMTFARITSPLSQFLKINYQKKFLKIRNAK